MTTTAEITTNCESTQAAPAVKALRVCQVLYRWSRCGLELQLASQLRFIDPEKITAWIASSMEPELQVPEIPEHVIVESFTGNAKRGRFAAWLTKHLSQTATDVVHARGLWVLPDTLRAAESAGGLPVIASFHGFDDASRNAPRWRRRRWRDALEQCDAVVTVSESARLDLARSLDFEAEKIKVIYNGVDTEHFGLTEDRDAARQWLDLENDRPVLLCVGSLMPVKGYDVLINVLHEANLPGKPPQLLFVGTDHLGGALQELSAEMLPEMDVRFAGSVDDVRPYYAAADALIVPSRSEGFSNVILEAMASGLPVLASAVGGMREQVLDGETGWLVSPQNPAALASAIRQLLTHPTEARRRGLAGRDYVHKQFGLIDAAAKYQRLYERVHHNNQRHIARINRKTADEPATSGQDFWPLNDKRLRWYAYARVAWWHLLASLNVEPGDNVVLPDLICHVMVEPLALLGAQPRYYHSEPLKPISQADLEPYIDDRTRAVLAVHYFGLPQPIDEALCYCRSRNVPLVEDVSQAFLSTHDGKPLGQLGDAALFSFRKTLHLPHGAGLMINNAELAHGMANRPIPLPAARRDVWRYWGKQFDDRYLCGTLERMLDTVRGHLYDTKDRGPATGPENSDPFERCLVRPSRTARLLTAAWDLRDEAADRRASFERVARIWAARKPRGKPLTIELQPGWVPYAFAVQPDNMSAEELIWRLNGLGLLCEPWPRLPQNSPPDLINRRWVLVDLQ